MRTIQRGLISAAFIAASVLTACAARAFTAVGDPNNPAALQAAIISVYNSGASGVTINPGKYVLPQSPNGTANLTLNGFTRSFEIDAYSVEFVLQGGNDGIDLISCSSLTVKGATLDRGAAFGNQGRITAFGLDPNNAGVYYDVQGDAGYPSTGWGYNEVMTGNSHVPRPGCYDLGWVSAVDQLGNNKVRIHSSNPKNWNGWSIQVGDYMVSHAGGGPLLEVNGCNGCMIQNTTLYSSPCWCAIREDNCNANRYYYDTITYGPTPSGATNPPLLSTGSGFQGVNDYVGPDVEACYFEGTGDDGFDLRGQLVSVTAVSGNTVTVASPGYWTLHDPIRLSDSQGGYADAVVNGISGSVLTLSQSPGVSVGSGITTMASNPNRNCGNYRLINDTVRDNRARGILVRGDGGLIQGCTLVNNTLAAILVGLEPGYAFSEGDYSHNVTIQNNTITNAGYAGSIGAISIGGCGSLGNQNILIRDNVFSNVWGPNISANGVTGLTMNYNTFANTYQSSLTGLTGSVVALSDAANITLNANLVTAAGPYQTGLVSVGSGVTNVVNNNASGIATGVLSSGVYKLTHLGTTECLDVYNNASNDGQNVQQYMDDGSPAQRWMMTDLLNGRFKLTHQGTSEALGIAGGSLANGDGGSVNGNAVQRNDTGSADEQWTISDQGNGSSKLTNFNSGKCLDVWQSGTTNGTNVDQYTDNGGNAQRWVLDLISPIPSPNLTANGSFEADGFTFAPSNWSVWTSVGSNASYAQNRGLTPDGDYCLVNWSASPYTVDTSQMETGLTNGALYTATAWVSGSPGISAAYFYANGYNGSSQLYVNIPASYAWTKITINNIPVANGQCRIGLHTQDTAGNHAVTMDNVQFFQQ